jgi:hypothetical protein
MSKIVKALKGKPNRTVTASMEGLRRELRLTGYSLGVFMRELDELVDAGKVRRESDSQTHRVTLSLP